MQSNYEKAYALYEAGGPRAVYAAVTSGLLSCDGWTHCVPCEDETPTEDGVCLVCGTITED
jgi:hypothetical protein